jgi:hypothetical protein
VARISRVIQQLDGKYPFLNVRLALLSRTLSPEENLHEFVGPFLPYSLLDTVVWLAHVTSAGSAYGSFLLLTTRRPKPVSLKVLTEH